MEAGTRFKLSGGDAVYDKFRADRLELYEPIMVNSARAQDELRCMAEVITELVAEVVGKYREIKPSTELHGKLETHEEDGDENTLRSIEINGAEDHPGLRRIFLINKEYRAEGELCYARYFVIAESESGYFGVMQSRHYPGFDELPEAGGVTLDDDDDSISWFDLGYFIDEILYVDGQSCG